MKSLASIIFLSSSLFSLSHAAPELSLDDLMTPDEIAEEAGLETLNEDFSFDDLSAEVNMMDETSNGREFIQKIRNLDEVVVLVNKAARGATAQLAVIFHQGREVYRFYVSTGREKLEKSTSGKRYVTTTPVGYFRPREVKKMHISRTWSGAKMPWTVFFIGGIALHGTTSSHYKELGTRASGGCVRFKDDEAKLVYDLILKTGRGKTSIISRDGTVSSRQATQWKTVIIVINDENIQY